MPSNDKFRTFLTMPTAASAPSIALVKYLAPLNVQVMHISELRDRVMAQRWPLAPHRVDFCHLIAVTSGDCSHLVDFVPVRCQIGNWLLIKPGQVHSFDFVSKWEGWLVSTRAKYLSPHLKERCLQLIKVQEA